MTTAAMTREAPSGGSLKLRSVARVSDEAIVDLPGLPPRLASLAAELRLIARNYPVSGLASAGLGDAIEQAQDIREMAHALTAVLAGEAERRGIPDEHGLSRNDWVTAHSPNLEGGQSAAVTAVGAAMTEERWRELAHKVRSGAATVQKAAVIVRFWNDVHRVADPLQLQEICESLVEHVETLGLKELRRLVAHARIALKPPRDVEDEAARLRAGRSFTKVGCSAGLTEYRLRLDPEGAAIIDAAIDPLARPRPDLDWNHYRQPGERLVPPHPGDDEGGDGRPAGSFDGTVGSCPHLEERHADGPCTCTCDARCACRTDCTTAATRRDPRTAPTRRADALLELIGRAVAAPEGVTRTPRTQLVITMTLEALLAAIADTGGCGTTDSDEVLPASSIRRLACEATILPAVLSGPSRVLDLGYAERYFTPAQRRALAIRDKHCTYPGCTIPPQWCEAHHIEHWCHGGPTDLSNGALLCGRHHTVVHQLELTATVTSSGVTWHAPTQHR
ncbi:MAG: DUF222 domain-containing protein [Intrasporangium sp.]|uniref:HNH endonuclease signature motif containing protein n=1 Tax=Intrasporangium sp. TaxID=1925024 RepID=UPI003F7D6750